MLTHEQMQADIEFLAKRAGRAGKFSVQEGRDWGISSNSLVSLAYGVGSLEMPGDWWDYAACERALSNMPVHRQTDVVREALVAQKKHVAARWPEGEGHYTKAMPSDLVNK